MGEIRTITTLCRKRKEIADSIRLYERQLDQARADLAQVTAAVRIFEASGDAKHLGRYVDTHRLFQRGETWRLCSEALAARGSLTTRELAQHVMKAKSLDTGDKIMTKAIGSRLIHSLRCKPCGAIWSLRGSGSG